MITLARNNNYSAAEKLGAAFKLSFNIRLNALFKLAAVVIVYIKLLCQKASVVAVIAKQKRSGFHCIINSAGGVYSWAKRKSNIAGADIFIAIAGNTL